MLQKANELRIWKISTRTLPFRFVIFLNEESIAHTPINSQKNCSHYFYFISLVRPRFLAFFIQGKQVLRELMDLQKEKKFVFGKEYLTPELNVNLSIDINLDTGERKTLTRQISLDSMPATRDKHTTIANLGSSLDG